MTPDTDEPQDRLQALLARAAEEQIEEQRQVSAVLAQLRQLVVDLDRRVGDRLGSVEARLDALAGRADATADLLAALSPAPSPTAESVADVLAERLADRLAPLVVQLVRSASATPEGDAVDGGAVQLTELLRKEVLPSVREAVADGERRLAAHVDEAVLALAGVLLRGTRRRTGEAAPAD